jgi:hypothetical protein
MPDMGFVLYDNLVKKCAKLTNVTIIPSTKRGNSLSRVWEARVINPYEFAVLSSIIHCQKYGFDAGQLSYFFIAGKNAMANALGDLVEKGLVRKKTYNVYDSGIQGVGMPRTEFDYTVDLEMLDTLVERKKAEKTVQTPPSIAPVRVPVDLNRDRDRKQVNQADYEPVHPAPAQDVPRPVTAHGQPLIFAGTKGISKEPNPIHDCHLYGKSSVLANDTYTSEDKAKLDPFLAKLARNGNVLATLNLFHERFDAYLEVCEENAEKEVIRKGALKIPSKNSRAINGLLRTLREPYNTVLYEQYELKFFALMNVQNQVIDNNSVVFVNNLRELYNKGELERYFYALPKKAPG